MGDEQLITCWECTPPTEWKPTQFAGHGNKHRIERKRAEAANDSSSVPIEARVNEAGETTEKVESVYEPPQSPPRVITRPRVADGLIPYLSLIGLAVHRKNQYDGDVIAHGIPGLVNALDDVAQQNDSLYRLLEGLKKGDSPNFRLVLATLAILLPVLANHRPESGALRNVVGGLRLLPGTDIPPLPKPADVPQEAYDATEDMVGKMKDVLENMTDDEAQAMADAMSQVPPDLIERMVKAQTVPTSMQHPEFVGDEPDASQPS
jgi:hypothetical protein